MNTTQYATLATRLARSFLAVTLLAASSAAAQTTQAPPAAKPAAPATVTPAKSDTPKVSGPAITAAPLTADKLKEIAFAGTKPTAQEILTQHVTATGGAKQWEAKSAMTSKGSIEIPSAGLKGAMEMMAAMPDRVVVKMDLPGMGETRTGFDGTTGWVNDPMRGPALMEAKQVADLKRDANFRRDLDLMNRADGVELVGLFEFEGKPCWQVKVTTAGSEPASNFYDQETGMMSGMTLVATTPMGAIPVTVTTTDYKDFGDVKIPTKTTTRLMGQSQVMTVDSVNWDAIDAKAFELPAEIKALRDAPPAKPDATNPAAPAPKSPALAPPAAPVPPATK